jgi:hypothetical protein
MIVCMEAGGIEPRNLDLQVLLQQALARVGWEGLASCLVLLCSDEGLAHLVEAWPHLSTSRKRLILEALGECRDAKGCQ